MSSTRQLRSAGGLRVLEAGRMALRGIRTYRLRSALTALGIVIGIAAVILLVALGNGLRTSFSEGFGSLATQITVTQLKGTVPGGGEPRELKDADAIALRDSTRAPSVAAVTPVVTGTAMLRADAGQVRVDVRASTADYLEMAARKVVAGVPMTDAQVRDSAEVTLLGSNAVEELFDGDRDAAVGQQVRIGRTTFTVIGVLKPDGHNDDAVVMPITTARSNLFGSSDEVNQVLVKAVDTASVPAATEQVTKILDGRHFIRDPAKRDFNVRAMQGLVDRSSEFLGYFTLFMGSVAAISLLVGGIGVANIMLVAVTERTREIGIRKAIGANRRAVLTQFLIEAMVLTGLGGLLGIVLGVAVSVAAGLVLPNVVPNFPVPSVSLWSVWLAFGVSVLIGLVAGLYPAARAARLQPIDALRTE